MVSQRIARAVLWVMLFLICCGLGYSSLARYDPRTTRGTIDSRVYLDMVEQGPPYPAVEDSNRVLIPMLARPFFLLARNHVGSWDPAAAAMLVANSALVALSALLLFGLAHSLANSAAVGLLAALLLLVNFTVPHVYLAGLVDAGELCILLGVTSAMWFGRWWMLPFLGIAGAAAKETVVLTSVLLTAGWLATARDRTIWRILAAVGMAVAGVVTTALLLTWTRGHVFWPWDLGRAMRGAGTQSGGGVAANAGRSVISLGFLYAFIWLLPLGAWRTSRLPKCWLAGLVMAMLGLLAISAFGDARSNFGRLAFVIAGPPLCLSAAILLLDLMERANCDGAGPTSHTGRRSRRAEICRREAKEISGRRASQGPTAHKAGALRSRATGCRAGPGRRRRVGDIFL